MLPPDLRVGPAGEQLKNGPETSSQAWCRKVRRMPQGVGNINPPNLIVDGVMWRPRRARASGCNPRIDDRNSLSGGSCATQRDLVGGDQETSLAPDCGGDIFLRSHSSPGERRNGELSWSVRVPLHTFTSEKAPRLTAHNRRAR